MANISINNRKKTTFTPQIIQDYDRTRCNFLYGGGKVVLKYKVTSPTPVDEDFPLTFFSSNPGASLKIEVAGGTVNGATTYTDTIPMATPSYFIGKSGENDIKTTKNDSIRVKFDSEMTITVEVKPLNTVTHAWSNHSNSYVTLAFDCTHCVPLSGDEDKATSIYAIFLGERVEYKSNGCHNIV